MLGQSLVNDYIQANEIRSAGHCVFHMSSTLLFLFLTVLCSLAKYTFVVEIIRYGQEFLIVLKCLVSLLYKDC